MENQSEDNLDQLKLVRQDGVNMGEQQQYFTPEEENQKIKQKIKQKRIFKPKNIITISFPTKLEESKKNKRKYQTLVQYKDEFGKLRRRVVKFGSYKQKDLLNQEDQKQGKKIKSIVDRLKNTDNALQSNYWRQKFLNKSNDVYQNYIDIIKENEIN